MKKFISIVIVLIMVFTLAACTGAATPEAPAEPAPAPAPEAPAETPADTGGDAIKIGFSLCSLISEFFELAQIGVNSEAAAQGVELVTVNADGDAATQKKQIEDLISAGCDAIIVISQDSDAIVSSAADCAAAGIPFLAISRQPSDMTNVALFIGFSNELSCNASVEALMVAAGDLSFEPVKAIHLIGDLNDTNAVERQTYYLAAAEKHGIEVVADVATEWDLDVCFNRLTDTVQTVGDFNAILSPSDFLLPSIMSVLAARNEWVTYGEDGYNIIVSIDGSPDAIAMIKEGYLYATANNNAIEMGQIGIQKAVEIITGGAPANNEYMIPVVAITSDIVDQF